MGNAEQVQNRAAELTELDVSPESLMTDFIRLAQLKGRVHDLPSTALVLGQEADALIIGDDGLPLYKRFEDMPYDDVKLFVMKSIKSKVASNQASSLIREESIQQNTMLTKLEVFYRGKKVQVRAIKEGDKPIDTMVIKDRSFVVKKQLEAVEGFIFPSDLGNSQLGLRPILSVLRPTLTDHYRVNMINEDAEPRVDLTFL